MMKAMIGAVATDKLTGILDDDKSYRASWVTLVPVKTPVLSLADRPALCSTTPAAATTP